MKRALFLIALVALLAAAVPALAGEMPDPIKDAKVGEWVLYKMGPMQQKQTVVAVDAGSVTVKVEMIMNGKVVSSAMDKTPLAGPDSAGADDPPPDMKPGKATVTVKGQSIECLVFETTEEGKKYVTYISTDVPVHGMVRTTQNGRTVVELIDFGSK